MSLPPLPSNLAKRREHRAPPGSGMLLAFCASGAFWTLAIVITLWLR